MPQQTIDSLLTYDLYLYPSDCGKLRMVNHVSTDTYLSGGCVQQNNFEPLFSDSIFIDGVAGYYFHEYPSAVNNVTDGNFQNTYWFIANSSCGTPLYLGSAESQNVEFKSWPNPATDFINFDVPAGLSGTLEIFDLSGKLIKTSSLEKNIPVDIRSLADGIYFGKISSGNGMQQGYIRFAKN
jgi:hypothetical protein